MQTQTTSSRARSTAAPSPSDYGLSRAAYSINEACKLLSISRMTFYRLVKAGELRPGKLGKKTLVYANDIADLLGRIRKP